MKRALLSPREFEIARLIARGLTNPEVGAQLGISKSTVSIHEGRILRKLRVRNRVELTLWWVDVGQYLDARAVG